VLLLDAGVLFPIGVQAAMTNVNCEMIAARAAARSIMASSR
jgi:hypothetical protein